MGKKLMITTRLRKTVDCQQDVLSIGSFVGKVIEVWDNLYVLPPFSTLWVVDVFAFFAACYASGRFVLTLWLVAIFTVLAVTSHGNGTKGRVARALQQCYGQGQEQGSHRLHHGQGTGAKLQDLVAASKAWEQQGDDFHPQRSPCVMLDPLPAMRPGPRAFSKVLEGISVSLHLSFRSSCRHPAVGLLSGTHFGTYWYTVLKFGTQKSFWRCWHRS